MTTFLITKAMYYFQQYTATHTKGSSWDLLKGLQ